MNKRQALKSKSLTLPVYWLGGRPAQGIFTLIAFFLLCFSALHPARMGVARTWGYDVFAPVLDIASAPIEAFTTFVQNIDTFAGLQAQNQQLRQENQRLNGWYARALELEEENKHLKTLLRHSPDPQQRYITARILSDSSGSFVKTLLITAGAQDGVQKNQAVLAGGHLIGRIIELSQATARVLLITDSNARVPVLIENVREHAILSGQNDDLPYLNYLPPDTKIEFGARIVTSGYGGIFPPNLTIGHVVFDEQNAPRVQIHADFRRLTHVRVVETSQSVLSE